MYEGAIRNGEAWRVLTSAFIHFDLIHFACNMYSLFQLGLLLENYLGPVKYTILYIAGIAGSGLLIELVGGEYAAHGGASGAIWALMTAAFLIFLFRGANVRSMLLVLGVNLVYTFMGGLSWQGHIGGGIAGLLTGGIYILLEKKHIR